VAEASENRDPGSGLEKPKPAGYYEGETMTRRTVFAAMGQAFGGAAFLAVSLPVVGFAVAPIFDRPDERWEGVGPADDFVADTYRPSTYIAISSRCAHLGCPVRFVNAAGSFICPCHGGVYDFEGKVIGGPPVRPLDRFQTRVAADRTLEIGPRYSVTNDLEPVRARDPGEFTGGIWEYLYPPRFTTAPPP
jgi:Rieske Fe-S protein